MTPHSYSVANTDPASWLDRKVGAPAALIRLAEQGKQLRDSDRARQAERQQAELSALRADLELAVAEATKGAEWLREYRDPDAEPFTCLCRQWRVVFNLSVVGWQPVVLRLWRPAPGTAAVKWLPVDPCPWAVPTPDGEAGYRTLAEALAAGDHLYRTPF